ncbi:hypothetical protein ACIBG8_54225 [Nonomuraea sp. NPDC050556]|uniref:hypothetical protein n=1 Tax=Nonomuraea sp. NPDC050556 TaxID=3364369 RepID=UPI00379B0707
MSRIKSTEGRLTDLEAEAFRTGLDLPDIKTRIVELRAGVDARFTGIESTLTDMVEVQVEHSEALAELVKGLNEVKGVLTQHGALMAQQSEMMAEILRRLPE